MAIRDVVPYTGTISDYIALLPEQRDAVVVDFRRNNRDVLDALLEFYGGEPVAVAHIAVGMCTGKVLSVNPSEIGSQLGTIEEHAKEPVIVHPVLE